MENILNILLEEMEMIEGGDIDIVMKLTSAAKRIENHGICMNCENWLATGVCCYYGIPTTEDFYCKDHDYNKQHKNIK